MNINLEQYRVFYCVAKNKNITRAANELLISQPAISKTIKVLEEQLNMSLFVRKRDGVELTDSGKLLYEKIKTAMEIINSAEDDINSLNNMEKGTISIGASKTIIHEFLMPYIKEFHRTYPNINIKIYTDNPNDLIKKVNMGIVDIIFTNLPNDFPVEFETIKLIELHNCLAANKSFKYLRDKEITPKDLESLPLIVLNKGLGNRNLFDDFCIKNTINVNPKMEFSSNSLIKDFTKAGFGIGMLAEENIKDELKSNELFKLNTTFQLDSKYLGMTYDKSKKNNIIINKFIKIIKKDVNN